MNQNTIDLSKFQCHFTWDFIPRDKPKRYLRDRIKTIECELESQDYEKSKGSQSQRNLPQLYALKGYLYTQLYKTTDNGGGQFLDDAENSFLRAYEESITPDPRHGYLAVIYGGMIHLSKINDSSRFRVDTVIDCYNKADEEFDLENHPEVLAMRGFTASFMHCHEKAIEFYQRALKIEENAEWLFGLALVKLHWDVGRSKSENDEVEMLLRQAIQLDTSYNMAKVKLARLLWEERGENGLEEVDHLTDPLVKNMEENGIILLEELSVLLARIKTSEKLAKGVEIYKICLERNPTSQKTLRGLGNHYFHNKWLKKKAELFLNKSLKYFTDLVSDPANAKPFDITKLGYIHLAAYKYYKELGQSNSSNGGKNHQRGGNQRKVKRHQQKAEEHKSLSKEWYERAAEELKKGHHDLRSDVETCFRLSECYKEFEPEREIYYLKNTLIKSSQGSKEDAFGELDFVKKARERLLEVVTNKNGDPTTMFQTKAWAYEQTGHFESALFYLEKAINLCRRGNHLDMFKKRAELCLEIVKDKRRRGINFKISMNVLDEHIQQLPDGSMKQLLVYESQKIRIEELMSSEEVLECLEKSTKEFEDFIRCHNVRRNWTSEIHEGFVDRLFDIAHASKVVLDRSVKYIKVQLYPEAKDFIYYPKPAELKEKNENERRDALRKMFDKTNKWTNFDHDYKVLFEFFVDRLDLQKYPFIEGLVEVRNMGEHDFKERQLEALNKYFKTKKDKIEFARLGSKYAADVWNFVKTKVDNIKHQ